MIRHRLPLSLVAAALVVAPLAATGCGDDEPAKPRRRSVEDLQLPSPEAAEAAEKYRDAQVFLDAKKPHLAEPLLRRVLELTPDDPRVALRLARCVSERGQHAEAVPLLQHALLAAPRNGEIHALLCKSLAQLGDGAATEAAARAWAHSEAGDADAYYFLGTTLYGLGRYDDAIAAFRRAEILKATRADIRSELGLALAASGDLVKAEAKQRDAIDRQPSYAEAWFRLGDVIFRRDPARAAEAVEAMDRAVELEPSNTVAHLYLFRVTRLAGVKDDDPMHARGEQAWTNVLRLHGRAQTAAALGAAAKPDDKASEYSLREQISLHPDDPAPRIQLAHFLHADRRWDEAIDAYQQAIAAGAPGIEPRVHLAAALATQAALLMTRRAGGAGGGAEASDAATTAAQAADRLRAAESTLRAALATAASATPADTASSVAPSVAANRLLAWVLLLAGRDTDAEAACDAVLALAPDDVLAKKLKALARMHRGDVDAGLNEVAALGWL